LASRGAFCEPGVDVAAAPNQPPDRAGRALLFDIAADRQARWRELNAFAPTVLATYPTVAAQLAALALQGQLGFAPSEVWTGGETLSPAARRRIEQGLGCGGPQQLRCVGIHAHGLGVPAGQDARQRRLGSFWNRSTRRAMPHRQASPLTQILLTNLANQVQPLIRYDLGDQITVAGEPCACGSTLPVIEVRGRRDEALVMAGLDGQPVTLLPMALTTLLEEDAGVFDFQLVQQDAHRLVLRLDLHGAAAEGLGARCQAGLTKYASEQALAPIQIRLELGAIGPRGRSGKVQRWWRGQVAPRRRGKAVRPSCTSSCKTCRLPNPSPDQTSCGASSPGSG